MASKDDVFPLLSQIELTRDLGAAQRQTLAEQSRIGEIGAKKRIRWADTRDSRLFLVDGHIARRANGIDERLESYQGLSDPQELFGELCGDADFVVTETPCLILKIPAVALEELAAASTQVDDIELDPTESAFLADLYQLISSNTLELPSRPEVALKIQELTTDPDAGIAELTEVIQRDGTIAGALLHATNSPLFRAAQEIQSVRDAVLRLGFRNTRMLATNVAMRQAFKARHQVTREAMDQVWVDGVLCSAYSYLLSDVLKVLHRERALLAGLVAGIGAVPIVQFIETRDTQPSKELIQSLIAKLSSITGVLVINYWGLGDDLVTVAEQYGNWGYHSAEPTYASITTVARWAVLQSEGRDYPDAATVPAFSVLGLAPPACGEPIAELADSGKALEGLKAMFNL